MLKVETTIPFVISTFGWLLRTTHVDGSENYYGRMADH